MLDPVKQPPAFDGCVASVKRCESFDISIQQVLDTIYKIVHYDIFGEVQILPDLQEA